MARDKRTPRAFAQSDNPRKDGEFDICTDQSNHGPYVESEINLFISMHNEKNTWRAREFAETLRTNIENKYINNIIVVYEKEAPIFKNNKITYIPIFHRPTYSDFFKIMSARANKNTISILANSDIIYDETINLTKYMRPEEEAYALLRWEHDKLIRNAGSEWYKKVDLSKVDHKIHDAEPGSQDTWIFRGKIKEMAADFCLGLPACDNAIAWVIKDAGYELSNPAMTIKTHHHHESGIRNYMNTTERVWAGNYLMIFATELPGGITC
jgi:hypothetical protein